MKIETLTSNGRAYAFLSHTGPWRVGDRVAYTREYCALSNDKNERARRRKWRGVIVSCAGGASGVGFLVMDTAAPNTELFEVWSQHFTFLVKLGR